MAKGDEGLVEHGDAATRRHRRIGALQDLSRARTNLDHATGAVGPDPETATRLEEIEEELNELRRTPGSRSRKRTEQRVLDLLLTERLLLDQLGFATFADYARSRDGEDRAGDDLTDLAYLEFARMELESAQERLDAIDSGELDDLDDIDTVRAPFRPVDEGVLEPYLVVPAREVDALPPVEPHGAPLEAWTAEPTSRAPTDRRGAHEDDAPGADDADTDTDTDTEEGNSALPHLGTTDLGDLDLPYWDETA